MTRVWFENKDDLKKWLRGQPRRVAVAIAARAAMRALPTLETWLARDEEKAISIVLPTFRATSASRFAAADAKREALVLKAAFAAFAADAAASAAFAAFAADAAASAADAAASAADAFAAAGAARVAVWKAVEDDAHILERQGKQGIGEVMRRPLWPYGMPEKLQRLWASMKQRLLAREGEHWEVWTTWYDARLDPSRKIPCYSPPDENLERARILLPEKVWEAGPATANAEIRRLIDEHDCSRPPPPEQLDGVQFEMDEAGQLDVRRQPPDEEEADNPLLQEMFQRIRRKLAQLSQHMAGIGNQYPELANVIRDYETATDVATLAELDVPTVWMTGLGLVAQAEAFGNMDNNAALIPRLEPEVEGLLREVAGLHGAFIMGFRQGRELVSGSIMGQLPSDAVERLQEAQKNFLDWLLQLPDASLSTLARSVIDTASNQLEVGAVRAEDAVGKFLHVPVNITIAVSSRLASLITSGMLAAAMGPEGIKAWLQFFQTHGGIIAALAQTMPELRAYLRYLFDRAGWNFPNADDERG